MKFRDIEMTDVIILQNYDETDLEFELINLAERYYIVDLQFSTTRSWYGKTFHHALVLVGDKDEK